MLQNTNTEPLLQKQPEEKYKVWYIARTDLNMPKGKIGAQFGHGTVELLLGEVLTDMVKHTPRGEDSHWEDIRWMAPVLDWYRDGQTKIGLKGGDMTEVLNFRELLRNRGVRVVEVIDNGTTMFNGEKTLTLLAVGPALPSQVQDIIGHLKPL